MTERVEVAIIGAGQAGLATSWHLKQAGVDHVVLEAGRVAETWRTRRWDSFTLVTPNSETRLPGAPDVGAEPDGFMNLAELIEFFERWTASFGPPVRENTHVPRLEVDRDGRFNLAVLGATIVARTVVVASGAYQRAYQPSGPEHVPATVQQVLAEDYRNPAALPPGNVLVVGSGQTGCQIAEEIHEAGRRVFLSCGRCPWLPRRLEGRDTMSLMHESGFVDRTPDVLPSPAARLSGNPQATGRRGGYDLHYRTLHRDGVELLGRFLGVEEGSAYFADDLAASIDFGDARWRALKQFIDASCARRGVTAPCYEDPPPMRIATRAELDLAREGVTSLIWTGGYRPDYGWVHADVFDDMGFPIQKDGRTTVSGLYFVGVHWMRKQKSAILYGVGEDAEIVARQIVAERR